MQQILLVCSCWSKDREIWRTSYRNIWSLSTKGMSCQPWMNTLKSTMDIGLTQLVSGCPIRRWMTSEGEFLNPFIWRICFEIQKEVHSRIALKFITQHLYLFCFPSEAASRKVKYSQSVSGPHTIAQTLHAQQPSYCWDPSFLSLPVPGAYSGWANIIQG